jgi:hypothetical protein
MTMKTEIITHIKQLVSFNLGRLAFLLMVAGILTSCEANDVESHSASANVANWSAELVISGGFAGVHRRLTVNGHGEAHFTDHKTNTHINTELAAKQLYDLAELVKNTPVNESPTMGKAPSCRDCYHYELQFEYEQRSGKRSLMDITINQSNASALITYLKQLASDMSKQKKTTN